MIPKEITDEMRAMAEKWRDVSKFDPRAELGRTS